MYHHDLNILCSSKTTGDEPCDLVSKKADMTKTRRQTTALALKRRSYLRDYSDPMQ